MVSAIDVKALSIFLKTPVSQEMVHKLVVSTLQVIPCSENKAAKGPNGHPLPSLMTFINRLVKYTNVYTGTLMATLVLLDRLKSKLPQNAQGLACTRHRIFLSCLILASKFHNDSSPKNMHWANYTDGLFSLKDVNLMERQLLYLLNWNVMVSNEEMVSHLGKFLAPIKDNMIKTAKMRKYFQEQAKEQAYYDAHRSTISRSSSSSSTLSLGRTSPASRDSFDRLYHTRQSSCSSVESVSPSVAQKPNWRNYMVHPSIEMAARSEETELNRMLNSLSSRSSAV